jgi:Arc/MetJ family transcription regulator
MAANLAIDDALLVQAQGIAGIKTKRETVNLALKELSVSPKLHLFFK